MVGAAGRDRTEPVKHGRSVTAAVVLIAALLLIGRGAAMLYVNHAWFDALEAQTVWNAEIVNTLLLYGLALVAGTAFAYANIAAVRRSIVALIVPKRIANLEIGEELSTARLFTITFGMSLCAAATSCFALPHWTLLGIWRTGVRFGEADPYFGLDLGHYVAWLPLEHAMHAWAIVLVSIVALLVVLLYALTPSLRWGGGQLHATTYVRRHIMVLGGVVLLLIAWKFRLDAYDRLIVGSGIEGAFTRIDHRLLLPVDLILSIATVGAAVALVFSGWFGHTVTSMITVTMVIVGLLANSAILPWVARLQSDTSEAAAREAPYIATQQLYTARAFPEEPVSLASQYALDSVALSTIQSQGDSNPDAPIVYPGARGTLVVSDSSNHIAAPHVKGFVSRIWYAWSERSPALFEYGTNDNVAVVATRGVRQRIRAVAPIFTQSRAIGMRHVDTDNASTSPVWIVDLYTTSSSYPLSVVRYLGSLPFTYRKHVAVAYLHGNTGEVRIVPNSTAEPISRAWFAAHGGGYLATIPTGQELPFDAETTYFPEPVPTDDTAFRGRIQKIYRKMKQALDAGNLREFGDAFDSLGHAVENPR